MKCREKLNKTKNSKYNKYLTRMTDYVQNGIFQLTTIAINDLFGKTVPIK